MPQHSTVAKVSLSIALASTSFDLHLTMVNYILQCPESAHTKTYVFDYRTMNHVHTISHSMNYYHNSFRNAPLIVSQCFFLSICICSTSYSSHFLHLYPNSIKTSEAKRGNTLFTIYSSTFRI